MTETPIKDIQVQLDDLTAKLTDKGVKAPEAELHIKGSGQKFVIVLFSCLSQKAFDGKWSKHCWGTNVAGAFKQAQKDIAAMPDPEDAALLGYQRKVAEAVDYGHEHSIADEYVAPLKAVSQTIHDKLLPAPEVSS